MATISSPSIGSTFRAGDTLTFAGSGSDAEDGVLAQSRLTWWADLHHDSHSHPFVLPKSGGSGSATIPVRGEVSANIFYRFHLRATDSAGVSREVTRDVLPRKAQVTLATQPSGLGLTLDGQPITAPHLFTGVVGTERDLGAATQAFNCRSYQFGSWSDGGTASHTISTPVANTTYTATFIDQGPAGNPPTVTLAAPGSGTVGTPITLTANANDGDGTVARVQFFDGGTAIGTADTSPPYSVSWTPSSVGIHTLTARATDNCGLTATSTAVTVAINVSTGDTQPPTVSITEPAQLADGLTGSIRFAASASDNVGVVNVEFQVDGVTVANDTSPSYEVTVDTTPYASGQHVLRARASDAAGNRSAWVTRTVRIGPTKTAPGGFTRDASFVTGLSSATAFTQLPDGRLLVAQQGGALRVLGSNGTSVGTMLTLAVDQQGERGLLGVTPHPQFASNGFIYVYYTTTSGGTHNRISRFTVSGNSVVAGSEVQLVNLPTLSGATNHNGGALHFGNDGKLYVAVGDNANGNRAPDLNDPFGKMLRFNDDGSIPSDNPFCTTPGTLRCAIWARGLRNPFTFAVRASDGRIHINDVGENAWEEVNVGAAGANYGWPSTEGYTSASGITGPLFAYDHNSPPDSISGFISGCSIIGGAFYPGSGPFPPAYRGSYYFADYCTLRVHRLDLANGNVAYGFGGVPDSPVGLMVSNDGALLVLTRSGIVRFRSP